MMALLLLVVGTPLLAADWPQWRGPLGTGEAPEGNPPIELNEDTLRFRVAIPGAGKSTPIVWKNRIYLTTAVNTNTDDGRGGSKDDVFEWLLIALDRSDGSEVWSRVVRRGNATEGTHPDGSWAGGSAMTDGERVYAFFGSQGLYAYTTEGEKVWDRDFGDMRTRMSFGEGASPTLYGDRIVVNWDHEGDSFIYALNAADGKAVWTTPRDEQTSWSTPHVVEVDGKPQVIVSATSRTRSYDLATGELIWEAKGMTLNAIPSPVHRAGVVYLTSGFRGSKVMAIDLAGAKGDITDSAHVIWSHDRDTPYVPSPLLYGNTLYYFKVNNGILTAVDIETGKIRFGPKRIEGLQGVYASPVAAAGRIFLVGRKGGVVVISDKPELEILATHRIDDRFDASPVIVDNELYLRGESTLYSYASE